MTPCGTGIAEWRTRFVHRKTTRKERFFWFWRGLRSALEEWWHKDRSHCSYEEKVMPGEPGFEEAWPVEYHWFNFSEPYKIEIPPEEPK